MNSSRTTRNIKRKKKSGPTNPKFYKSEIDSLEKLKAKLAKHAMLTTGRDPRIRELNYECANAAIYGARL